MAAPKRPGGNAGKGRQKGVPNKLTSDLKGMILGALSDAGGRDYLANQAIENPGPFMTLIGKVLPTQLTGDGGGPIEVAELSAEERRERARKLVDDAFAPADKLT